MASLWCAGDTKRAVSRAQHTMGFFDGDTTEHKNNRRIGKEWDHDSRFADVHTAILWTRSPGRLRVEGDHVWHLGGAPQSVFRAPLKNFPC